MVVGGRRYDGSGGCGIHLFLIDVNRITVVFWCLHAQALPSNKLDLSLHFFYLIHQLNRLFFASYPKYNLFLYIECIDHQSPKEYYLFLLAVYFPSPAETMN